MRVILIFIIAFAAGFISRPWLYPFLESYLPPQIAGWINPIPIDDETAEAQTFGFTGFLTEEGLRGADGTLPPGEGPDQLFDLCDPVDVLVTLTPREGPPFFATKPDGGFIVIDNTELSFRMTAGPRDVGALTSGRAIVRSGEIENAFANSTSLSLRSSLNSVTQRAIKDDAFGYVELIPNISFHSDTVSPAEIETYDDLVAFLEAAETTSGRFEFRHCDASLNGGECPPVDEFGLPFENELNFSPACEFR